MVAWNSNDQDGSDGGIYGQIFNPFGDTSGFISLTGSDGDDTINAGDGNEVLIAGTGNDMLTGGDDDDLFVFSDGDGQDTIADFAAGAATEDRVDLTTHTGANTFAEVQAAISQAGADTVIDLGAGDSITLLNVNAFTLSQDDFLF